MKKIIIFGTSGFAEVAYFYLTHDSDYEVVAFTSHKKFLDKNEMFGLPVVPFEELENFFNPNDFGMFVAVVYTNLNKTREKIFYQVKDKGYELISYINSKATVWGDTKIGVNCFILENVVIQPFVSIGDNVIIWSGNHIGHHTKISDHCFITSHVVISGNVEINSHCFLGVNSTIRDGVKIAPECIIGAGSVILHDTKPKQVFTTKGTILLPKTSDEINL